MVIHKICNAVNNSQNKTFLVHSKMPGAEYMQLMLATDRLSIEETSIHDVLTGANGLVLQLDSDWSGYSIEVISSRQMRIFEKTENSYLVCSSNFRVSEVNMVEYLKETEHWQTGMALERNWKLYWDFINSLKDTSKRP